MKYDSNKHHRRSIRLRGYDYSRIGLYFVTICTDNHQCLFGDIINDVMILNERE
jgi:putative transposase